MDAKITKSLGTYDLLNLETGKMEAENLLYQAAKTEQNILWARGIKTKLWSTEFKTAR